MQAIQNCDQDPNPLLDEIKGLQTKKVPMLYGKPLFDPEDQIHLGCLTFADYQIYAKLADLTIADFIKELEKYEG